MGDPAIAVVAVVDDTAVGPAAIGSVPPEALLRAEWDA
jgi:hypothetical protein